jgi:activator of 2-hydroxyglutaryl-CoA dehydratase
LIELAIASAFVSAMGYQQAGRAARMEGALTARNIKEQAKIRRLQALQEHNDIMANLQTFKSQNAAVAGTTGRDMGSDRSYKALLKNAEQNTKTLAQRSNYQNLAEQSKYSQQALMAVTKANNISRAYRYKAFGTLISGAYKTSTMV